tara:strand:+ start:5837 stop:6847 length:1011 start_codon:yes stop_codon:yes gene_type:complete
MNESDLDDLIKNCLKTPDMINNLSDEQVDQLSKKITPYGQISHVPEKDFTCFSITNLRESYIKRLVMVSIVGYIYRSIDEYNGTDDKTEIKNFMDSLFEFNPDYHAKTSSNKEFPADQSETSKLNDSINNKNIKTIPADVFYRIDKYMSINYEKLRNIVDNVFCEKADFDYIINIYDSFESSEAAAQFTQKYQDQFLHDIYTVKNNSWVFLGPFAANRNKINFYNENTDQLKAILTQVEMDQKLGKDLLKKRVTNTKRINIRNQGKHNKDVSNIMGSGADGHADDKEANDLSLADDPFLESNHTRIDIFENDGLDLRKSHFYADLKEKKGNTDEKS